MTTASDTDELYLGFDLSTQQLKCIAVNSSLKLIHEAKVDFDADLKHYGITKGVLTNPAEGEVFAPPAMWLEALELVLQRLQEQSIDFGRVRGISGAGMQHGTVFWSHDAEHILGSLDPGKTLVEQLNAGGKGERPGAFAHPFSPNWQDASTQKQCDQFDALLGSADELARITGSKAHHRFSGPQILRYRTKYPKHYEQTARISLVSSFLASVLLGKVAPIDISDVTGMDLWDIKAQRYNDKLLALAAGDGHAAELETKLGQPSHDDGESLGQISSFFVRKYGFSEQTKIIPFTGDNPATILALPLRPMDAMVSLGTSTTYLMSTSQYKADPEYHMMNHPTTKDHFMFMLCYKNGGLAREQIRDAINNTSTPSNEWSAFNKAALDTPPLSQSSEGSDMQLGLFFPQPEIVPNVRAGRWNASYSPAKEKIDTYSAANASADDARHIVESQMLSIRARSQAVLKPSSRDGAELPPQPRRIYLVGGGSANPAIAKICGEVLGSVEGIFKLDIGGNACALGAAYKAVWGCERQSGQSFEDLIGGRWDEASFVKRVADGYSPELFKQYGQALPGLRLLEQQALQDSR